MSDAHEHSWIELAVVGAAGDTRIESRVCDECRCWQQRLYYRHPVTDARGRVFRYDRRISPWVTVLKGGAEGWRQEPA